MIEGLINTTIKELNLSLTLISGQSFRWRKFDENNWIGIIDNKHVIQLTQNIDFINYKVLNQFNNNNNNKKTEEINQMVDNSKNKNKSKTIVNNKRLKTETNDKIRYFNNLLAEYFRLEVSLEQLYSNWSKSDENFAQISPKFPGVRILRQNPTENLFSFICSSNNNISRISKMVNNLCRKYGHKLFDSQTIGTIYSFPDIKSLAEDNVENELRALGFGYRSKFINRTAKMILDLEPKSPENWLKSLQSMSYENAKKELMKMPGIGAKVADCICLMSLNHLNAIPVDTHVYQIAVNNYLPKLKKNKSLTDRDYRQIGINLLKTKSNN
jgi:N-glycosylase/DNA lyase